MFVGGMPPSHELLQAHLKANTSMSAAMTLLRGGPVDAWRWRYIRVKQEKQEVVEIIRDVIQKQQQQTGGGLTNRHAPARWAELPRSVGWRQHAGTWNVLWTWRQPKINWNELLPFQKVNHFPQARQLTRKDLLKKHLHRQRKLSERAAEAFDIMPLTFSLPSESLAFHDAFSVCEGLAKAKEGAPPNVWILKPVGLSRGRGISMVDCISDVSYGEQMVIQRYVPNPLLVDGFKFDLRLYVLVTSFQPLEAYLYKEGFGRFATATYSLEPEHRHNLFAHLTNSSIQKDRPDAADGTSAASNVPSLNAKDGGTKVALSQLKRQLASAGVDVNTLWSRIVDVVLRSLYAVQEAIPSEPNSFELFGYDILIDDELKPWLIEVNASPSLARDHPLDVEIKDALIADTLDLIAPPYYDRAVWREMLRWRAERGGARNNSAPPFSAEMCALLHGTTPRANGSPSPPLAMGLYERIAPSLAWDRVNVNRANRPPPMSSAKVYGAAGRGKGSGGGAGGGAEPPSMTRAAQRAALAAKFL